MRRLRQEGSSNRVTGSVATHCCSAAGTSHLTAAARPRRKFPPIHGLAPSISSSLATSTPPFRLRHTLRNSILPMAHLNRAPYPAYTWTRFSLFQLLSQIPTNYNHVHFSFLPFLLSSSLPPFAIEYRRNDYYAFCLLLTQSFASSSIKYTLETLLLDIRKRNHLRESMKSFIESPFIKCGRTRIALCTVISSIYKFNFLYYFTTLYRSLFVVFSSLLSFSSQLIYVFLKYITIHTYITYVSYFGIINLLNYLPGFLHMHFLYVTFYTLSLYILFLTIDALN